MAERNRVHQKQQVRDARQKREAPKRKLKCPGLHGTRNDMLANSALRRGNFEFFWAWKLARRSQRNWKKRYFILDKSTHRLAYYKRKSELSNNGEHYRGTFKITENTTAQPHRNIKYKAHVVRLSDTVDGDLFLSFRSPFETIPFIDEVKQLRKKIAREVGKDELEDEDEARHQKSLEFYNLLKDINEMYQSGFMSLEECNAILNDNMFKNENGHFPKTKLDRQSDESDEEDTSIMYIR